MTTAASTAGDHPIAEVLVLERVAEDAQADVAGLRAMLAGRVISTGDRISSFEVVEIVPPDEPALVGDQIVLEFI
jgi:hypothetical protein